MKQLLTLLLLTFSLLTEAQTIRYDTISVSADDERNIYPADGQYHHTVAKPLKSTDNQLNGNGVPMFDRKKLRFGADLGLSISRNYTRLGIGPQIGYQLNRYLLAGAGIKYYYTRAATTSYEIKSNLTGANLFGYLYPTRFITFFAQPELNYIHSTLIYKSNGNKERSRGMLPSLVVGGGLRIGRSHITLNYDLVQHVNSPHPEGFYLGVSAFF